MIVLSPGETHSGAYRALISDVSRFSGWKLPALIMLMAVIGVTEGLTVSLLLPLLMRVGIAGTSDGLAATVINSFLSFFSPEIGIGSIVAVIILLSLTQMLLYLAQSWWIASLIHRYTANWQTRLFSSFLKVDWLFLTGRKGGELASAIVVESTRATGAFHIIAQLGSTTIVALVYVGFALLVSWQTMLLLVGIAAVMVLSISRLYRISHEVGRQSVPLNAEMQVVVNESLATSKLIKSTVSEDRIVTRFDGIVRALERAIRTSTFLPHFVRGVFEFLALAALVIFIGFGMVPLGVAPADMLIVLALFVRLFPRFITIQTLIHSLNTYVPAVLVMRGMLLEAERQAERTDGKTTFQVDLPSRLEVRNLSAGYGGTEVLQNANLTLALPGMVGIVGGSGAGKSTLVHTLLGFIRPRVGTIRLGPCDMADVSLAAWRHAIGYVPQETMFFHSSVAENLALAKPGASKAEIVDAAKKANAHDFIMNLPQGYDTLIGDQGVLLSGGQRQRLAIARAIITQPALLIMDEPTSALDGESEREILATLEALRSKIGILIVAHRLATVRHADRIFVLDDGRVVEDGPWDDLIAQRSRLHALARIQHMVA